jgi:glycosyltransferase involved in cell wall biosynthesis
MRVCIATGAFYRPHETQINFHILNLFGGNTVVLARQVEEADPYGHASHIYKRKKHKLVFKDVIDALHGFAMHRNLKVPQGVMKASIKSFLLEQNVDAVLAEFGTTAIKITPAAVEMGIPVFAYFRGKDASSVLQEFGQIAAYRRLMPNLRGVFAVSQFLLDNLAHHGIRHPESHVIPSGVDISRFLPGEKQRASFLSVGRFIDKKRPDIVVSAFADAAWDRPEARLEMIGDGPLLEKCRSLAFSEGVANQIIFHGRQSHDFVRERLKNFEVFVQHSVVAPDGNTEGLPTGIQEAMAAGMPVISTRHAGIPEAVIEGQTGFLVTEGDKIGFAKQMRRVLDLEYDLAAMGARARAVAVERFDNRKLIKKLEEYITMLSRD